MDGEVLAQINREELVAIQRHVGGDYQSAGCSSSFSILGHVNVLQFGISLHRGHAEVAADAAAFETAEGRLDVDAGMGIDAENAALDAPRDPKSPLQIARPERSAQAVGGSIDIADHLLLVAKRHDLNHRAKDFFAPATIG